MRWACGHEGRPSVERARVFGILTIAYLFLGGAGAGAVAIACAFDLACVKTPFGLVCQASFEESSSAERACGRATIGGAIALVMGALCLMFDLGRIDRVDALFVDSSFSYLSVGAWALAALIALSAYLCAARLLCLPTLSRPARAVECVACFVAFIVMAYTGLLLQFSGAAFAWHTAALPLLFVLSSASCGIAALLLSASFEQADVLLLRMARAAARIDMALIAIEAATAVMYLLFVWNGPSASRSAATSLAGGDYALWWWVGFVALGLIVPFATELAFSWRLAVPADFASMAPPIAVVALCVLMGGFAMRYALVGIGEHRSLELQSPIVEQGEQGGDGPSASTAEGGAAL